MGHSVEHEELIALYLLGALDKDEAQELSDHLKSGCEICERTIAETNAVLSVLPYSLDDTEVPDSIKRDLLKKINDEHHTDSNSVPLLGFNVALGWLNWAGALALLFITLLLFNNMFLYNKLKLQQHSIARLSNEFEHKTKLIEFMHQPSVLTISLASDTMDNMTGMLLWDTDTNRALLYVPEIPLTTESKSYQFWVMEHGEPHSMGTFQVNTNGSIVMKVDCMPKPEDAGSMFITLEPKGGMPKPTGATYLVGSLK